MQLSFSIFVWFYAMCKCPLLTFIQINYLVLWLLLRKWILLHKNVYLFPAEHICYIFPMWNRGQTAGQSGYLC